MAHQAHNIPWSLLINNLAVRKHTPCQQDAANFHMRHRPAQAKELTHFTRRFVRALCAHADSERRKYPAEYERPGADEIVVPDEICRKVHLTVRHARQRMRNHRNPGATGRTDEPSSTVICRHQEKTDPLDNARRKDCGCALPWEYRQCRVFLRPRRHNECYRFDEVNGAAFLGHEVFKALLLHGAMDALLRVYAHGDGILDGWTEARECECEEQCGWGALCSLALDAYLLLNVIHGFPETWDAGGRSLGGGEDQGAGVDYRDTAAYQKTVRELTRTRKYGDVAVFPHRKFFGIADDQFPAACPWRGYYPFGRMAFHDMLRLGRPDSPHVPTPADVRDVRRLLRAKGLPWELGEEVLHRAGLLGSTRLLEVAHDPFDERNRDELAAYIKYSWVVLVRCETLAKADGSPLAWEVRIGRSLERIFGCETHPLVRYDSELEEGIAFL